MVSLVYGASSADLHLSIAFKLIAADRVPLYKEVTDGLIMQCILRL